METMEKDLADEKGSCYHTVFIVSNWALACQYEHMHRTDKESWDAFLRRIKKVNRNDLIGNQSKNQSNIFVDKTYKSYL